jgi:hypothetical protein
VADKADDQCIRILHLSDTHFKASKKWDADPVLRALAGFIRRGRERLDAGSGGDRR